MRLSVSRRTVLQMPREHVEGASDFGEVTDEPLVEVHKSYEGLDVLYSCQLWPVCDSLDFNGVYCYMVFGDDKPKVVHLLTFEFAFLRSEEQLVGTEGLEYLLSDPPMVCKGGRVDEDVIHVANGFIAVNKGVENVIHHCLEGSWQVAQSKEHDEHLEESSVCGEGHLPFIPFLQLDIVEAPTEVQGGEPFRIVQPGEHVRDQQKWVGVLHCDLVQLPVVLH